MASQSDLSELERLHEILVPALSKAALGDFSAELEVAAENSERMNELIMGVGVLLEVIREKLSELEEANVALAEAHERSVDALDEVLGKSLERDRNLNL